MLAASFAVWTVVVAQPAAAVSTAVPSRFTAPTVFIFYYDWYGGAPAYTHWNGGNAGRPDPSENITSDSYPVLGPYSSASTSVIKQHMAWMKAAHVDVVTLSWWGQGSPEDRGAKAVMDGAAAVGLKVNFMIENYGGETESSIFSDIAYIYRKYGSHPAFYRVARPTKYGPSSKPRGVFFLYSPPSPRTYVTQYARSMDGIRGTANDAIVMVRTDDRLLNSNSNLEAYLGALHFDGMLNYGFYGSAAYSRALPQSNDYILLFSVSPGFDNSRAPGVTSPTVVQRSGGSAYDGGWSALIGKQPEWVSIVSFNEWHETTQIEPAKPFTYNGFQYLNYESAYGLHGSAATTAYINRTAFWAGRFHASRTVVRPQASPPPAKSPSPKPTSSPSAPAVSVPGQIAKRGPEIALFLIIIGGLIAGGVMLWQRRRPPPGEPPPSEPLPGDPPPPS